MKSLIQNDIIGSIEENLRVGNITMDDARRLRQLTHRLYDSIYSHYDEMEEVNVLTDESLMLDIDIIEKKHEQELAEKDKTIAEKEQTITALEQEIYLLKQQLKQL